MLCGIIATVIRMLNFYKEKYEHMLNENRSLTQEKEKTLNIFTSIIILAIFPILSNILEIEIWGYRLANLIIFAILAVSVVVILIYTFYLYVRRYEEIEITDMNEVKQQEDEFQNRAEEIIAGATSEDEKEELRKQWKKLKEDAIEKDYIERYNLLFKNYKNKNKKLRVYYILIIVSVSIEVTQLILLAIDKIFL